MNSKRLTARGPIVGRLGLEGFQGGDGRFPALPVAIGLRLGIEAGPARLCLGYLVQDLGVRVDGIPCHDPGVFLEGGITVARLEGSRSPAVVGSQLFGLQPAPNSKHSADDRQREQEDGSADQRVASAPLAWGAERTERHGPGAALGAKGGAHRQRSQTAAAHLAGFQPSKGQGGVKRSNALDAVRSVVWRLCAALGTVHDRSLLCHM